jgi:predicted enzyme related to lactoylglutathione lyase
MPRAAPVTTTTDTRAAYRHGPILDRVGARFTELSVDAHDVDALARFWCAVLGWNEVDRDEDAVEIADPDGSRPTIVIAKVADDKVVKNRVHLDVSPVGSDQAEELERLLALGATRVDVGQGEVSWIVLADPEGNEFCLLSRRRD